VLLLTIPVVGKPAEPRETEAKVMLEGLACVLLEGLACVLLLMTI